MSVLARLAEERKRLSFSAVELAQKLGIDRKTIHRWEGSIAIPADALEKLSTLGFDAGYVVTGRRAVAIDVDSLGLADAALRAEYLRRTGREPASGVKARHAARLYNQVVPALAPDADVAAVFRAAAEQLVAFIADDPGELDRVLLNAPAEERAATVVTASGKGAVAAGRDAVIKGKKR